MLLGIVLVNLLCSAVFFVEGIKWALPARRWALMGLLLGPMLLPMFGIAKHVQWRRSVGFNNLYIAA